MKELLAGIIAAVLSVFGGHQAVTDSVSNTAAAASVAPSAIVVATSSAQNSVSVSAPPTVINQPVIERIVERTVQTAAPSGGYVTESEFSTRLNDLSDKFGRIISGSTYPAPASTFASGGVWNAVALTNRIDQLSGTSLSNITVSGVSGLTDADIPDGITASNYLPLLGGTLSGDVSLTNATSTNFFATLGRFTTGIIDTLTSTSATITNLIATTITGTNATFTNATTTNATSTNLYVSGTTTLATTTISNLIEKGPWFDVRAYGAACDGVTDDTSALNNAIGAAVANGGTVVSRTGTCTHQPLTISSPVTVDLAGSTWKLKAGSTSHQINITSSDVSIVGGTLDGDSANNPSAGSGIMLGSGISDLTFQGITFLNHTSSNIRSKGVTGPVNSRIHIVGNTFNGAGGKAVFFNWETQDSDITDNLFLSGDDNAIWVGQTSNNVRVTGNTISGYDRMGIEMTNTAAHAVVQNNFIRISGSGADAFGISLGSATSSLVSGNTVELTSPATSNIGIEIVESDHSVIEGNNIINAGIGISINKTSDSIINSNRISAFTGSYGIFVTSSEAANARNNIIQGNRITISKNSGSPVGIFLQSNSASANLDENQILGNNITGQCSTSGCGTGIQLYMFSGSISNTIISNNLIQTLFGGVNHLSDTLTKQTFNTFVSVSSVSSGTGTSVASDYFDNGIAKIGTIHGSAKLNFQANSATNLIGSSRSDGSNTGYVLSNGWGRFYTSAGFGVGGDPGSSNTGLYVANSVGIGTTTPWAKLSIAALSSNTSPLFTISTSTASATSTAFLIDQNGLVGIATTTPWRTFSVTGTVGFDGLTGSTGAGSLCLSANKEVVYNSGSDSCLSSTRATKHDILPLDLSAIDMVTSLQPVSFIYNNDASSTVRYGFIAEDTAAVDAHLATYDAAGAISGIDDRSVIALTVRAVQSLISTISEFADRFTTRELTFTRASGDELTVKKLCVEDVCVTRDQFLRMVEQSGQAPAPSSPTRSVPSELDEPQADEPILPATAEEPGETDNPVPEVSDARATAPVDTSEEIPVAEPAAQTSEPEEPGSPIPEASDAPPTVPADTPEDISVTEPVNDPVAQ